MKKSTDELLNILDKNKNLSEYLSDNKDEFISDSLADYLARLLDEKQLKKAEVIKASLISTVYGYQIFSGLKAPSRDRLIQLALGMRLNLEETQRLLKIGGGSVLYPRNKRDSVIIYAINNSYSVLDCDEVLYELGEKTLQ
jgi:predicted transcriptional regulator